LNFVTPPSGSESLILVDHPPAVAYLALGNDSVKLPSSMFPRGSAAGTIIYLCLRFPRPSPPLLVAE
jgi:hypothetical protein